MTIHLHCLIPKKIGNLMTPAVGHSLRILIEPQTSETPAKLGENSSRLAHVPPALEGRKFIFAMKNRCSNCSVWINDPTGSTPLAEHRPPNWLSLHYDSHDFSTARILSGFKDANPHPQRCSPLQMPISNYVLCNLHRCGPSLWHRNGRIMLGLHSAKWCFKQLSLDKECLCL